MYKIPRLKIRNYVDFNFCAIYIKNSLNSNAKLQIVNHRIKTSKYVYTMLKTYPSIQISSFT